jgi:outer membrane receptor protein involved in Fe transport
MGGNALALIRPAIAGSIILYGLGGNVSAQEAGDAASVVLPEIEVVQTTPTAGSFLPQDKLPASITFVNTSEIARTYSPDVTTSLERYVPGVNINQASGNAFQPDLEFRGFLASPVSGTPQGVAVYQNGVRINEAFGDIVNWDFIPTFAIQDMAMVTNNPAFGLNALGGAVNIQMKSGFTYQGFEANFQGGSFGRGMGSFQWGLQNGPWAAYVAFEAVTDAGWRDFSRSTIRRGYADLGYRGDQAEFHLSFTGADNSFGAAAATPIELLSQNWGSVYTTPQTTHNQLAMVNLNGQIKATDTLTIDTTLYFRSFRQGHVDGNTTDVQPCANAALLCFGDDTTPAYDIRGQQVPNLWPGAQLGEIDRSRTATNSFGGSLQATQRAKLFDHDNNLVVGASLDLGNTRFVADSELGFILPNLVVAGTGYEINQIQPQFGLDGPIGPVRLKTQNIYGGLYALDTFNVTPSLAVTVGGRFNYANIELNDQFGTALNGSNTYTRFNPVVGATYKIASWVTAYAGYSEANRAPTPLELGCADPARPCIIDSFLVSDPPLKQVVARTFEAGLRGNYDLANGWGQLGWNLGVFHTESSDDILNVPSEVAGFGYYRNVGKTLRQGVEAALNWKNDRWTAYASYSYLDATFQSTLLLSSPNNPYADANGNILVHPGDKLPATPPHRVKIGFDYAVTDQWKVGADAVAVAGSYLTGDESNQNPRTASYATLNLHTSYDLSKNVQFYGLVQNVFNRHYYTSGAFFQTDAISFLPLTNPRTMNPGAPFVVYAGIKAKF